MKKINRSLILISLLMGSPVFAQKAVDMQDFEQVKQMMLPVLNKSLTPLKETRQCVVISANSDQLNACVKIMAEFQKNMAHASATDGAQVAPELPPLEWNRAMVEQIRSDLDSSIAETSARIKCMQSSSSHQAMEECMKEAGFGKKR